MPAIREPVTYPVYLYDFDDGTTGHNIFGSTGLGSNEATIAPGDSGGGSLVQIDNTWEIVGVHSFTACYAPCSFTSIYGQWGGDMPVYSNLAWLDSILPASSPVPEPATASLLGMALFGLGLVRRQI